MYLALKWVLKYLYSSTYFPLKYRDNVEPLEWLEPSPNLGSVTY